MNQWRLLLLPFSLIYSAIIWIRNTLYNMHVLHQQAFEKPIIAVGNIVAGGTGKTPMVEYIIRLLRNRYHIATLSRGYGRSTKGYIEAGRDTATSDIGDEPMQYNKKFADVTVAVCEDRVEGIAKLQPNHDVIVLDDAYQRRSLKVGVNILLIDYNTVFEPHIMLPAGNAREPMSEKRRADVIVITKTPKIFSPMERRRVESHVKKADHQLLTFSYIQYNSLVDLATGHVVGDIQAFEKETIVLLLTGIAGSTQIQNYVQQFYRNTILVDYPDHYAYKTKDIQQLVALYEQKKGNKKVVIITTEKDAMRLNNDALKELTEILPIYYIEIEVAIHEQDKAAFDALIINYVRTNTTNGGVSEETNQLF